MSISSASYRSRGTEQRRMNLKSLFRTPLEELEKHGDDDVSLGTVEQSGLSSLEGRGGLHDSSNSKNSKRFEGSLGKLGSSTGDISVQSGNSSGKGKGKGKGSKHRNSSPSKSSPSKSSPSKSSRQSKNTRLGPSNHSHQSGNSQTSASSFESSDPPFGSPRRPKNGSPPTSTNLFSPPTSSRRSQRRMSMGVMGAMDYEQTDHSRADTFGGGSASQRQSRRSSLSMTSTFGTQLTSPRSSSVRASRTIPGLTPEDLLAAKPGAASMRSSRTSVKLNDDDSFSFKTDKSGTSSKRSAKKSSSSSKKSIPEYKREDSMKNKDKKLSGLPEYKREDSMRHKEKDKDKKSKKKNKKEKDSDIDEKNKHSRSSSTSRPKKGDSTQRSSRSSSVGPRRNRSRSRSASPGRTLMMAGSRHGRSTRNHRSIDSDASDKFSINGSTASDSKKSYDYNNSKQMKKDLKEALKKVRELMDERREYADEASQAKSELLQARMNFQEAQSEHHELRAEIKAVRDLLNEKNDKIDSLEMAIESQMDQIDDLTKELKVASEETYAMEDRVIELEAQLDDPSKGTARSGQDPNSRSALAKKDEEIRNLKKSLEEAQNGGTQAGQSPVSEDVTALQRSNEQLKEEMKKEFAKFSAMLKKKDETISYMQVELTRMKTDLDDREFGNYMQLKKEVESSKTEAQVAKSQYEGVHRRCMMLEEDIDHWKRVSCDLEDELDEQKAEAAKWKKRYEDLEESERNVPSAPPSNSFFGGSNHSGHMRMMRRGSTGAVTRINSLSDDGSAFSSEDDPIEESRRGNLWSKLRKPAET